ncbi:MAG: hypothetical protein AB8G96_00645 [Phycisphaerales bacterium]
MQRTIIGAATAALLLSGAASAELVQIDITGSVDFGGLNFGSWAGVTPGDSAVMSFQVDSDVFVDSGSFPTRGYEIINSSFSLALDGIEVGMADPYPAGQTPYFVLRDNDPAVDGFFLANSPDAFPNGVAIDEDAAINPQFNAIFQATYGGDRLSSLDILDATGVYDFTGLSVFNWGIEDAGFQPMGFIFDQFTISVVPGPAGVLAMLPVTLLGRRRRRGG